MHATSPASPSPAVEGNGDREKLKLKLRRVAIDTHLENVVYLHRDCSVYRTEGFRALAKIEVRTAEAGEVEKQRFEGQRREPQELEPQQGFATCRIHGGLQRIRCSVCGVG